MQFSTKIDGFEQNDSQVSENSYNSYEQYPLEKFLIFTIYQNYTLALRTIPSEQEALQSYLYVLCGKYVLRDRPPFLDLCSGAHHFHKWQKYSVPEHHHF